MEMAVDLMVIPRSISSCLDVSKSCHDDPPRVGESHLSGLGTGNNTSLGDERVGKGRLSVIDMGNNRHVSDVGRSVHCFVSGGFGYGLSYSLRPRISSTVKLGVSTGSHTHI